MKNNEFNQVKVNNEGPSSIVEFTIAQKTEATFHSDNSPHKDELNAKKTNNDSVSDSAVIRKHKEGKIDYKKIKDGTIHLTSTAGHAVVAATTVSVAVVATVVGVSVIPEEEDYSGLITFISSEITSDSIDFAFSFPAKLIAYYQEEEETEPVVENWKELTVSIGNENEETYIQPVEGYEELTPDVLAAYCYFEGLNPDTTYGLSIDLHEYYVATDETGESKVVENTKQLAFRSFTTEPAPVLDIQLTIEPSFDSMTFTAILPQSIAIDETTGRVNPNLDFVAYAYDGTEISCYLLGDTSVYLDKVVLMGGCSELEPSSYYQLRIYQRIDNDRQVLYSKEFSTLALPTPLFYDIETTYNSVSFALDVAKAYSNNQSATSGFGADLEVVIEGTNFTETVNIVDYSETSTGMMTGYGSANDLKASEDYSLNLYKIDGNDRILLAYQEFSTDAIPSPTFEITNLTYHSVEFTFDIYASLTRANGFGDNLAVYVEGTDFSESATISSYTEIADGIMRGTGSCDFLEGSTTYTLELCRIDSAEPVVLASQEFTTDAVPTVTFQEINVDYSYVSFSFVCPREVSGLDDNEATGQGSLTLQATISGPNDYYEEEFIAEYEEFDENNIICYGTFGDLSPESTYTITILYLTQSQVFTIGEREITTSAQPFGFTGVLFSDKASYYYHTFDITLDFFDDEDNPNYSDFTLNLRDGQGAVLQSFALEKVTTAQTLTVSTTEEQVGDDIMETYDYDLDQEFNYSIEVYSASDYGTITVDTGTVTFIDSDHNEVIGFLNDSFTVCAQESNGKMPIRIDFVNESHNWNQFRIDFEFENPETGVEEPILFSCTMYADTNWHYIDFDYNEYIISDFIGDTATISVYAMEGEDALYTTTATIQGSSEWNFLDIYIYPETFTTDFQDFDLNIIYTSTTSYYLVTEIVFVDVSSNEEFIYMISLYDYPESYYSFNLQSIYEAPSGYVFDSQGVIDTYSGKTFNVYLRYGERGNGDDPIEYTNLLIQSNFSFTFD